MDVSRCYWMLMDVDGMLQWDLVLQFCYVFFDHR